MHVSGDSKRRGWLGSHDSLCGRRQGVELRFHMDEGLPTVRGDTGRIKQVPCCLRLFRLPFNSPKRGEGRRLGGEGAGGSWLNVSLPALTVLFRFCLCWSRGPVADEAVSLCSLFPTFCACFGVGGAWRTRQILHNLLSNAAKFTWAGFVSLRITSDRARGLLLISVSDRCSPCCPSAAPRWHDSGRLAAWGAVGCRRVLGRSRLSGPTGADWLLNPGQNSLAQRCQPIYSRLQEAHRVPQAGRGCTLH